MSGLIRCFVTDAAGGTWELPAPESIRLEYGIGTPCDSFLVRCPWQSGSSVDCAAWVSFYAEHGGARVFTGRVDECGISMDGDGCRLELSGRGMAALLLDNEAVGRDYGLAACAEILREHVSPYGIETVGGDDLPTVEWFRVDTGNSEWTVLEEFCRRSGGVTPRFDKSGRLILTEAGEERELVLDGRTPVEVLEYRIERYGVLSEIAVRDRYDGQIIHVFYEPFRAVGGRARRVLTMSGYADPHEMEREGRERLERAARDWKRVEVTLPTLLFVEPGQGVRLERPGFEGNGRYLVRRSRCELDGTGGHTRLTLQWADM